MKPGEGESLLDEGALYEKVIHPASFTHFPNSFCHATISTGGCTGWLPD